MELKFVDGLSAELVSQANENIKDDLFSNWCEGNLNLIDFDNAKPLFVSKWIFVIFTVFIPVTEVYNFFFNRWTSVEHVFTIRKVISTRYDLNKPVFKEKYKEKEKDLNEVRAAAGLPTRAIYERTKDIRALQSAAGI